jgi:hypothetical protein
MINTKTLNYPIILLILVLLVIADGVMTEFDIGSGFGYEANPFMLIFLSTGKLMWIKIIGALLSALILWDIHRRHQRIALVTSMIFISIYTIIVSWNIACIFIAGKVG